MRPFHGDVAGLTSLRLRRLLCFLRRWNLSDTAHAYVSLNLLFAAGGDTNCNDACMIQGGFSRALQAGAGDGRVLHAGVPAAAAGPGQVGGSQAEAYVAGLVDLEDCSRLASLVLSRIRVFGVMSKFAVGEASTVSAASFRRAEVGLLAHPELRAVRRVLDSMRSDPDKASRLYAHIHPGAVEAIMKWVTKCPEFKSKNRAPPRCRFDRTYIVSLGPSFWECRGRGLNNKSGRRIPAHILARCFMRRSSGRFCKEFRSGIMSKRTAASSSEG
ncbi:uncharacterized protein [Aegilops tauschii subsp. strangulata]|uniref:uncharacterized protein n=1 Tax=Aegilops tauschii subsp. strangulata TaxID=200361 RepID=UPI001ABCA4B4|nr:uncharacterized protein LOC120964604 [Aegilops tauschii subsp. strangulata]